MANVLVSWLGVEKDVTADNKARREGPTWNFYQYHYQNLDIRRHYLLVTEDMMHKAYRFKQEAREYFGYDINLITIDLGDSVHRSLGVVKAKVETILMNLKEHKIYILFSTGSAIMKVAWYLLHTSLNLDTHVLQILRKEDSKDKSLPDLVFLDFEKSRTAYSVLVRERSLRETGFQNNLVMTKSIAEVYKRAKLVAPVDDVSVLILGETGTGKEELAKYIHKNSVRRNKPFEAINCAAFTDELLESRLFGHAKGSFTGAYSDFKGVFERNNGGTVFLDEIGDISPYMQQALLRFLHNGEIQPIGKQPKKVNVRVIAATNKDVSQLVDAKRFRSDLFYRLSIILKLPALWELGLEEKQQIFEHFLKQKSKQFRLPRLKLCRDLENFLLTYRFPGNFRELNNILDHLYIFAEDSKACLEHLPYHLINTGDRSYTKLSDVERAHILKIYNLMNKNKTRTAEALGISVNTLKAKLRNYGIE